MSLENRNFNTHVTYNIKDLELKAINESMSLENRNFNTHVT